MRDFLLVREAESMIEAIDLKRILHHFCVRSGRTHLYQELPAAEVAQHKEGTYFELTWPDGLKLVLWDDHSAWVDIPGRQLKTVP